MLQLILGISGSGKSGMLMDSIERRARAGEHSILIVPEQFTSTTEGRLYRRLGDALSGRVDSYSFSSLAEALLARYGGAAVRTVNDADRAVVLRRALDDLGDEVRIYRKHRRSAAFCQLAAQTVSELKSAGISPVQLQKMARAAGRSGDKLEEIALIYDAYEARLKETGMDPGDRVALAARRLDAEFFAGSEIFIDEFDTFNAPKKRLLQAILPAADVTVALCCDDLEDRDAGMGLFSGAKQVAQSLLRMAENAGVPAKIRRCTEDLRHGQAPGLAALNQLLTEGSCPPVRADEITLYAADDRQAEAAAVAAAVQKCARAGIPYRRMAVICRSAELYQSAVRYRFRLAGIPLFCDEVVTPENTAPALAVRAALGLLRGGLTSQNILRLVKTGLTDLDREQQCALENYAYTWPLRAADWRLPFRRSPKGFAADADPDEETLRQLELAESARAFLMKRIDDFADRCRGADAARLSRQLYYFLNALGAPRQVERLAGQLRAENRLPEADETVREWNLVAGMLNQMLQLLGGEKMDAADYDELFVLLLRSTDLGHVPQSLDSVIFTTAGRMRLDEVDVCFVMGLAEGEFPETPGDTGLLTHAERDAMIRQGAELPDCFENRMIREQICFYKALTAAKKKLWLSWPGGEMGLELTSALEPVRSLLDPRAPRLELADYAMTPACALDTLGELWQENDGRTAALYAALQQENSAAPGLQAMRHLTGRRQLSANDLDALERLLGKGLYLSPSRVERFYSCRFAYFLEYVLHIKPRRKAELSPNQSGSMVHWILEQALMREGFAQMSAEQLDFLAAQLTQEYVRQNMPESGSRFAYLISRLQANVRSLLRYLQQDVRQSAFVPAAFEQKIGEGAEEIPPVVLTTPEGRQIRVVGTIDRVDALRRDGKTYLRVVDYKTGDKQFRLDEVYCGLDCQMLLYLFTLARKGGAVYPEPTAAGVLYLMADPAPKTESRAAASAQEGQPAKTYKLDGLILNDPAIVHAMDAEATGLFVPFGFDRSGRPSRAEAKLADLAKLGRIQRHIDHLVIQMARQLYAGKIDSAPLCRGKHSPCDYCDYRVVCHHEPGADERQAEAPEKVFQSDMEYKEDEPL